MKIIKTFWYWLVFGVLACKDPIHCGFPMKRLSKTHKVDKDFFCCRMPWCGYIKLDPNL